MNLNKGRKIGAKGKIPIHAGIRDFYKVYKSKVKEPLPYIRYNKILKAINEAIVNKIIYEGFVFKLPSRLGFLSIVRQKQKLKLDENGKIKTSYLSVDYAATKKLWAELYPGLSEEEIKKIPDRKKVYHQNSHSHGYYYRWFYDKFTSNCKNKSVYKFKPSRANARNLASYVKDEDFVNKYFDK